MTDIDHIEDVVYGIKDGLGLLLDVYTPRAPRVDAGVIVVVSGGWSTRHDRRRQLLEDDGTSTFHVLPRVLLDAGYVVFAVTHGAQPRYRVDEIPADLSRAVRFVRHHARRFRIDPRRLGIVGGSSGGHLALLTALAPPPADPEAADRVERESAALQAAVAYFPPTDLRNYGGEDVTIQDALRRNGPFDFQRFDDEAQRFERVTDPAARDERFRQASPVTHVGAAAPPVLLIHGDADELVPLQQSERLRQRLQAAGVAHDLVVLPGLGHAWPAAGQAQAEVVAWFARHLGSPDR